MELFTESNFEPIDGAIYSLDIETTSLFEMDDGSYQCFDSRRPPAYYAGRDKIAIPYIWMFGVNDRVYYGRDFRQLSRVFELIRSDKLNYVFVHNLSFEFQFLRDLLEGKDIERMICLAVRHPIAFTVPAYNIQFRCTYKLTNMTLAKAAETYTDIRKLEGGLDYNKVRTPRTDMTELELSYCEYDILTLHKIVAYFKKKYKRLAWIPYTATGEIRKEYRSRTTFSHRLWIAEHTPSDYIYLLCVKAFQGGMTHGNALFVNRILKNILSYDIASSYPYVMLTGKYPMGDFRRVDPERANKLNRDGWAVLYHVRFKGVKAAKLNKYILNSKIMTGTGLYSDNGRLVKADTIEMILTDIDFDIITKSAYHVKEIEYIECYAAVKGYLPTSLRKYIIELYQKKTTLRGVAGKEEDYMNSKRSINGLFGCTVTNILKAGCTYDKDEWKAPELSIDYIHDKLEGVRGGKSNCFLYPWGVWITAYARARLWACISQLDDIVVYYDTDSIKCVEDPRVMAVVAAENDKVYATLKECADDLNIQVETFSPKQPSGKACTIGIWDFEEKYDEFITCGAKRYAYKDSTGTHVTVSGVNKKTGYKALHDDLSLFTDGLVFDYETAGKLTSVYNDNQKRPIIRDYQGRVWKSNQKYGVALMPTEYNMGIDAAFSAYLEEVQLMGGKWIC